MKYKVELKGDEHSAVMVRKSELLVEENKKTFWVDEYILGSAQRVSFFLYRVRYWKKYWVRWGRGVEIYDRAFSCIYCTLGYFRESFLLSLYFRVYMISSLFIEVESQILRFSSFIY